MAKVTVVTAATGNPILEKNIESVARQTHADVTHLVLIDGPERILAVDNIVNRMNIKYLHNVLLHSLPYPVGKDRWNGHRIYAAATFLAESDYIMYLDEDTYLEPTHIEDCIKVIEKGNDWAFSLRKIVSPEGQFICNDDCENLGLWPSVMDDRDYFVDVNCYFFPLRLAAQLTPVWYRKAREPGVMEVDRALCSILRKIAPKYDTTYNYTVNYTVGNNPLSVQSSFFLNGNSEMLRRYNDKLPWRK